MARPPITDEAKRKRAVGVSLTRAEHDKLRALGGSKWLASTLAAVAHPSESHRHIKEKKQCART